MIRRQREGFDPEVYPNQALTEQIIGAAIDVHNALGPGLLESAYQVCLAHELNLRKIPYEQEKILKIIYKGIELECGYRIDFLVEKRVVLELKAVEQILPVHEAQVLTYLKLTSCHTGLILNFNVSHLKYGIRRLAL